jgi:hypothetical protein
VTLLADGIKKLRAIDTEKRHFALWSQTWIEPQALRFRVYSPSLLPLRLDSGRRGMKNLDVLDDFAQKGGTEHAPMSTTSDVSTLRLLQAATRVCDADRVP